MDGCSDQQVCFRRRCTSCGTTSQSRTAATSYFAGIVRDRRTKAIGDAGMGIVSRLPLVFLLVTFACMYPQHLPGGFLIGLLGGCAWL